MSVGKNIYYPIPQQTYKVLVRCFTFNHSKYIEDALNGFAMQQTNFPFVCFVMDDASTDGEQEVIKAWMERECDMSRAETIGIPTSVVIIVPHKSNSSCTFAFYLLKQNLYGTGDKKMNHVYPWRNKCEYEAICEGDDFWFDSLKLQKQVDYLDNNPDYSMCCSDAVIYTNGYELDWKRYAEDITIPVKDIILGGGLFIQTATLVYRKDLISEERYPNFAKKCHVGDYPLQIFAALNGKVYWFSDKMSVYRYKVGNSWTSSNMSKTCSENMIKGWQSEVMMLRGMDKISNGKYHDDFNMRIATYVFDIICKYRNDKKRLLKIFSDEIRLFTFKQKLKISVLKSDNNIVYNWLSQMYHRIH